MVVPCPAATACGVPRRRGGAVEMVVEFRGVLGEQVQGVESRSGGIRRTTGPEWFR